MSFRIIIHSNIALNLLLNEVSPCWMLLFPIVPQHHIYSYLIVTINKFLWDSSRCIRRVLLPKLFLSLYHHFEVQWVILQKVFVWVLTLLNVASTWDNLVAVFCRVADCLTLHLLDIISAHICCLNFYGRAFDPHGFIFRNPFSVNCLVKHLFKTFIAWECKKRLIIEAFFIFYRYTHWLLRVVTGLFNLWWFLRALTCYHYFGRLFSLPSWLILLLDVIVTQFKLIINLIGSKNFLACIEKVQVFFAWAIQLWNLIRLIVFVRNCRHFSKMANDKVGIFIQELNWGDRFGEFDFSDQLFLDIPHFNKPVEAAWNYQVLFWEALKTCNFFLVLKSGVTF